MWRQCFSRTVQMLVVAYLLYVCDSVLPVTIIYIFYRIIVTSSFQVSFPFYDPCIQVIVFQIKLAWTEGVIFLSYDQ